MPTYDFICNNCDQRFDVFLTFAEYGKKKVSCTHCNSKNVRRRMTKVRIAKSEESRMESMADEFSGFEEGLDEDPKAMARVMKKMGKEMGEELPPEFNEVVDRLESGQSPDEIESAIPDLGNAAGGADDDL
jgi:putative FmdB family regulatory protein